MCYFHPADIISNHKPPSMEQEKMLKPTVTYHLFLYRVELARRNARQLRLSRTKIEITDELISNTVRNLKTCSMDDLKAVNRELLFKRKLRSNVSKLKKEAKRQQRQENQDNSPKQD